MTDRVQSKCIGPMIRQCLFKHYKARLLLLEVQYEQGNSTKPFIYRCDGPEHEIDVSFFKTDPPTAGLSLGKSRDEPLTAVLQPSEKGENRESRAVRVSFLCRLAWRATDEMEHSAGKGVFRASMPGV